MTPIWPAALCDGPESVEPHTPLSAASLRDTTKKKQISIQTLTRLLSKVLSCLKDQFQYGSMGGMVSRLLTLKHYGAISG